MKAGGCATSLHYFNKTTMNSRKPLQGFLIFTAVLFFLSQHAAHAQGGFPDRPGRLLISPSVSYFFANSQWDTLGVKKPFDNNGKFNSIGITLYSEYGISRRFTVVGTLPYVINNFTQNVAPTSTVKSGLTDLETGIRYYL